MVYTSRQGFGRQGSQARMARWARMALAAAGEAGELSLVLCDDAVIQPLNQSFRGKPTATDHGV